MLAKFAKHCGQGWGADFRGVIFAKQYKNLDDMVAKGKKMFLSQGIGIKWLASNSQYKFVWPTGEELLFRIADKDEDYWNYHGHNYPFVGWEELTKWSTPYLYDALKSVNRSPVQGIPKFYLANTNPYGAGHHWVKERWINPNPVLTTMGAVLPAVNDGGEPRIRFDGDIMENRLIVENDPDYIKGLEAIENEALRQAWRYGSWEVNVGAYFHGYLSKERNMIDPFIPPVEWKRWRSYDWGSNKPWAIGYYAIDPDGIIYKYRELYGWTGEPDVGSGETWVEICDMMKEAEADEIKAGCKFWNNPADHNIFTNTGHEVDLAEKFGSRGYVWIKAQKGPGSRMVGLNLMKNLFKTEMVKITSNCVNFWRTVPNLMIDDKNWEDIDTTAEDHICDETRYSLVSRHMKSAKTKEVEEKKPNTALIGPNPKYAHLL
jgi:hypothetical protein